MRLLSNVFTTGFSRNIFVFGKPGTGKTLCVQYALGQVKRYEAEKGFDLDIVYVNAGKTRSPYYTLLEIVRALGVEAPDAGWQFTKLKQAFEEAGAEKPIIIAIDVMDALIYKQREPLIYYLNRQPNTTLILISNRFEDLSALPPCAKSTLQPLPALFPPYTPDEAKQILAERASKAFHPGAVPEKILDAVAEKASEAGDIRTGFTILLTAGYLAERDGKSRIRPEDVQTAVKTAKLTA